MSTSYDLSTPEGQQKYAFSKLIVTNSDVLAQNQAKNHPNVGLEQYLWKVTYFMMEGEQLIGYTSNEEMANLFRNILGWPIEKQDGEEEWTYQYSKCVHGDHSMDWIDPEAKTTATYGWRHPQFGNPREESYPALETRWKNSHVQKKLWWAFIAQRPPVETEKPRVLTAEFLKGNERLLPQHNAKALLKQGSSGIPKLVVEWVERSAREGPTAPPESEASEAPSAPAPV